MGDVVIQPWPPTRDRPQRLGRVTHADEQEGRQRLTVRFDDSHEYVWTSPPASVHFTSTSSPWYRCRHDRSSLETQFSDSPAEVVADLLREEKRELSARDVQDRLEMLGLSQRDGGSWKQIQRSITYHPNIRAQARKYTYSSEPVERPTRTRPSRGKGSRTRDVSPDQLLDAVLTKAKPSPRDRKLLGDTRPLLQARLRAFLKDYEAAIESSATAPEALRDLDRQADRWLRLRGLLAGAAIADEVLVLAAALGRTRMRPTEQAERISHLTNFLQLCGNDEIYRATRDLADDDVRSIARLLPHLIGSDPGLRLLKAVASADKNSILCHEGTWNRLALAQFARLVESPALLPCLERDIPKKALHAAARSKLEHLGPAPIGEVLQLPRDILRHLDPRPLAAALERVAQSSSPDALPVRDALTILAQRLTAADRKGVEQKHDELRGEINKLRAELRLAEERRALADSEKEQARRHASRVTEDQRRQAAVDALHLLVPVLDRLDAIAKHTSDETSSAHLRQLWDATVRGAEKHGLLVRDTPGQVVPFDPKRHKMSGPVPLPAGQDVRVVTASYVLSRGTGEEVLKLADVVGVDS